jgi:hypothetical protein
MLRPLCTAIVRPTISGRIIERRDQVLIGRLRAWRQRFSTFFARCRSTNGPFLSERGTDCSSIFLLYVLRMRSAHDHRCRALVGAGLVPLVGHAPRADRMRVTLRCGLRHRRAGGRPGSSRHRARSGGCRASAARRPCRYLSAGCARRCRLRRWWRGSRRHLAHLAGAQAQRRVGPSRATSCTPAPALRASWRALARLQLDAVHRGTDRDVAQRHRSCRP